MIICPVDLCLVEPSFGSGLDVIKGLCAEPHHEDLTFRVTEASVVLDKARGTVFDHEADEQDALVRRATTRHLAQGRAHDLVHCLGDDLIGHHGGWGVGAHTACVWSCVAFAHAFVVLRCAKREGLFAITEYKEAGFFAFHELLDHNFRTGCSKAAAEHIINSIKRFLKGHGDHNAFACGEAISLDDNRCTLCLHIIAGGRMFGKVGIARCGRARGIANLFGEGFGGFKLGSSGTWSEGQDAC